MNIIVVWTRPLEAAFSLVYTTLLRSTSETCRDRYKFYYQPCQDFHCVLCLWLLWRNWPSVKNVYNPNIVLQNVTFGSHTVFSSKHQSASLNVTTGHVFKRHHNFRWHPNAASAGPAERVEEVRKPAELGPIGPTQTPRLSSLGRKRLGGSSSGFKKESPCFYSITKFQLWRRKTFVQNLI